MTDGELQDAREWLEKRENTLEGLRGSYLLRELIKEVERLRADAASQLPEGMEHCTIVHEQCEKGHSWLRAINWLSFPCPTCMISDLQTRISELERIDAATAEKLAIEWVNDWQADEAALNRWGFISDFLASKITTLRKPPEPPKIGMEEAKRLADACTQEWFGEREEASWQEIVTEHVAALYRPPEPERVDDLKEALVEVAKSRGEFRLDVRGDASGRASIVGPKTSHLTSWDHIDGAAAAIRAAINPPKPPEPTSAEALRDVLRRIEGSATSGEHISLDSCDFQAIRRGLDALEAAEEGEPRSVDVAESARRSRVKGGAE